MENFLVCLNAVLPIFVIMALGYCARLVKFISREDVPRLNKLAFDFFMPFLMFYNIYTSDLSSSLKPLLIGYACGGVLCAYFLSLGYVLLTEKKPERRGVMIQGIYRSNFVIIGLPIAASLLGTTELGTVAVLVAIIVPLFNVLAVVTLEVFNGEKINVGGIILDILKNPLILSSAAGILALVGGLQLPKFMNTVLHDMSAATTPLLLFLLGAFFQFGGIRKYARDLVQVCIGRLIVIPAIFLTIAYFLGFRGVDFVALIGVFGSATAVSSFTMAQQMGGEAELAGDIVVVTSAACSFTLFGWAYLFKCLGVY
jgi:predicted permease